MRICCGITLYFPKEEDIKNIIEYTGCFDKIYVYNNTDIASDEIKFIENNQKIEIISTGNNDGLGVALDTLCINAKCSGYDYIMLFDQDSRMDNKDILRMIQVASVKKNRAIIYCPTIVYEKEKKLLNEASVDLQEIEWCITSGTMLDLSIYGDKILFDTKYFIDRVDRDICKQIRELDGLICRVNNAFLYQQLGQEYKNGHGLHTTIRHYYMARNRFYYNRKFRLSMLISITQTVKHLLLIILFEYEKKDKVVMVLKGIQDYTMNKMGRKEEYLSK